MGSLSASHRRRLPKTKFGEPGKRAYPMPDKIDAKANRILGKPRSNRKR